MFSSTTYHPQVAVALTHVGTVINSIRTGGNYVRIPKGGRGHRTVSRSSRPEVIEGTDREADTKSIKESQENHLDIESCIAILMEQQNLKKLSTLLGVPKTNHWNTNHISAPTFFENKNGFEEKMLEISNNGVVSLFHRPEVIRLLSQNLSPVMLIQRRGYQSEHHSRKSGIGTASFEKSPSMISKLFGSQKPSEKQSLHRILKGEKPDVQDKIKVAFTEGVMSKDQQSSEQTRRKYMWTVVKYALVVYILIQLYKIFVVKGGVQPGGSGFQILQQGVLEVNPDEVSVTFDDVKGCDEAKEELADIVEFLKHKEKFQAVGAKLPKGVLMVGSPGVGKTLLAKAVAGEAGVPFFQASGSEFDEMFVGSGSRKVRQLFSAAKARAPSVIFIDEIDSVGAKRTNSQIHPYANQTVNQLLSEMDGFSGSSGVIVIGATNKKENLDQALLRPGRFDMEVNVLPPDANGREEIFKLYLSKVNAASNLDYKKLGLLSRGMTGADINNIVNQAALHAVLKGNNLVTMDDLEFAKDKILMGPAWKNKKLDEKTILNTAYHEAGHTLVAHYTKEAMPLHKVTILPRGHALGVTSFLPDEELSGRTKAQLLAQIDVAMGGRAGEELKFGKDQVTDGASNDFMNATRIATLMVKKLGMSDKVGQRVHNDSALDGGTAFIQVNDLSPEMQQLIDEEINKILHEAYSRAIDILKSHQKEHMLLSEALVKYETLSKEEIVAVIHGKPLKRTAPAKNSKQVLPSKKNTPGTPEKVNL